jgi:predicted nucleic acid-binding protein
VADAAHIAFAEKTGASFISCDDRLVRKCLKHKIEVWCGNPVAFCEKEELK